jgi:hypothetical protein
MVGVLQAGVGTVINAAGTGLAVGGVAATWLWLRALYR